MIEVKFFEEDHKRLALVWVPPAQPAPHDEDEIAFDALFAVLERNRSATSAVGQAFG